MDAGGGFIFAICHLEGGDALDAPSLHVGQGLHVVNSSFLLQSGLLQGQPPNVDSVPYLGYVNHFLAVFIWFFFA